MLTYENSNVQKSHPILSPAPLCILPASRTIFVHQPLYGLDNQRKTNMDFY